MKTFDYKIKDELGIHARPAGLLVKLAKDYKSNVLINKQGTTADAKRIMALLSLAVTKGTTVTVQVEGSDEDAAMEALKQFFVQNL
jgi:phosphocarrier protein HPr